MVIFVNLASIASICVGFDLGTLYGYFSHQDFWPNLNFPLEYQIKLVLILCPVAFKIVQHFDTNINRKFRLIYPGSEVPELKKLSAGRASEMRPLAE